MNERQEAFTKSLERCQALEEKVQALQQAIEATQAKITALEARQGQWPWAGAAEQHRHDH